MLNTSQHPLWIQSLFPTSVKKDTPTTIYISNSWYTTVCSRRSMARHHDGCVPRANSEVRRQLPWRRGRRGPQLWLLRERACIPLLHLLLCSMFFLGKCLHALTSVSRLLNFVFAVLFISVLFLFAIIDLISFVFPSSCLLILVLCSFFSNFYHLLSTK